MAYTFLLDLSAAFFVFLLAFFEKRFFLLNLKTVAIMVLLTLVYTVVDLLFIKARQLEEVSKIAIVIRLSSLWSLLGGTIFFGEPLLVKKVVGVFLTIIGTLVVLWEGQKIKLSLGLKMIIAASFLFVSVSFVDKFMVGNSASPALYKALTFFIDSLWIFLLLPNSVKRIKTEYQLQKGLVIISGLFIGLQTFFLLKGIQTGEISKVFPVNSLSVIFSVLAGIFFLNEKKRMPQKIIGSLLAFMGVFFLS